MTKLRGNNSFLQKNILIAFSNQSHSITLFNDGTLVIDRRLENVLKWCIKWFYYPLIIAYDNA